MHIKVPSNLRGYATTLRNGVRKIIPITMATNGSFKHMTTTQMIFKIRRKKQIKQKPLHLT